jgi:hypothetical protein
MSTNSAERCGDKHNSGDVCQQNLGHTTAHFGRHFSWSLTPAITPADERAAFWVSVVRFALIGVTVLTGCLLLLPVMPKDPASAAVLILAGVAGLWLAQVAWMALSFVIDGRRERE